eukprot:GILI01008129.1.p1 GENE.GILI01008129.1~~GILI01008129.1.p1  ORF type:complete len:592 (+),score=96.93 GILI01008129.1:451-2226(+)
MPINHFACFEGFGSLKYNAPVADKPHGEILVTWCYPHTESEFLSTFKGVDKMCFPTIGSRSENNLLGDGFFVFVLTKEVEKATITQSVVNGKTGPSTSNGQPYEPGAIKQIYGHCAATVNGEAFVFLSPLPWVGFFKVLLDYYRGNGAKAGQRLLKELYSVPTPSDAGGSFGLRFGGSVLKRPMDESHLGGIDTDPLLLLNVLTDAQLCQIVSAMLLVEPIIVCGPDYGVVSRVAVALRGLISPVDPNCWVYASVLPKAMIEYLGSPVPGFFGITDDSYDAATSVCQSLGSAVLVQLSSSAGCGNLNEPMEPRRSWSTQSTSTASEPPFDGSLWCSNIAFLNTEHVPLPRTASVFSSSLRRGLAAIRATKTERRKNVDLLMLFVRYFAAHMGLVGAPSFTPELALNHLANVNKNRSDVKAELHFYERFFSSQCCVELGIKLRRKVSEAQWTHEPFSNMVVQLNPFWFGAELSKYRPEELQPVLARSSWSILVERNKSSLFCCDRAEDAMSDDEQGPSRNTSSSSAMAKVQQQPGGLYLTPNGEPALKEMIICREDVELMMQPPTVPNTVRREVAHSSNEDGDKLKLRGREE